MVLVEVDGHEPFAKREEINFEGALFRKAL